MKKIFFLSYSILLLCFAVFSYLFVDMKIPVLHTFYTGFSFENRLFTTMLYIAFVVLLFVTYVRILILTTKNKIETKEIKKFIGISIVILIFSYPAMLSYDIFNYIATAKVTYFYRENPYIIMPIEFVGDQLLLFMHAANKVALYGPSWIMLAAIPHYLGFQNFLLTLFNFKLLASAFYVLMCLLLWRMTKHTFSLLLFSLNPLVIIETLVSAHNDVVMMFFLMLGFYLLQKKQIVFSFIAVLFSVFIKYATLLLVPVFLYILWKTMQKEHIAWQKIYGISFYIMFVAFLLSPIREEIYPWYAIWFLPFLSLMKRNNFIIISISALSLGLLMRYTAYMWIGTYAGVVPIAKNVLSLTPFALILLFQFFTKYVWTRKKSLQ